MVLTNLSMPWLIFSCIEVSVLGSWNRRRRKSVSSPLVWPPWLADALAEDLTWQGRCYSKAAGSDPRPLCECNSCSWKCWWWLDPFVSPSLGMGGANTAAVGTSGSSGGSYFSLHTPPSSARGWSVWGMCWLGRNIRKCTLFIWSRRIMF